MSEVEIKECKKAMRWFEKDFGVKPCDANTRYNSWRKIFREGKLVVDQKHWNGKMPPFYYGFRVLFCYFT